MKRVSFAAIAVALVLAGCAGGGLSLPPDNSDKVQIKRTVPGGR